MSFFKDVYDRRFNTTTTGSITAEFINSVSTPELTNSLISEQISRKTVEVDEVRRNYFHPLSTPPELSESRFWAAIYVVLLVFFSFCFAIICVRVCLSKRKKTRNVSLLSIVFYLFNSYLIYIKDSRAAPISYVASGFPKHSYGQTSAFCPVFAA
jgi:hypothetical protein